MKKILALLIVLVCVFSCTVTANAASYLTDTEGSVEVRYHSYSNYTITVPEVFNDLGCYVDIRNAEIEEGYRVEVHATNLNEDGYLQLTHTKNPELHGYISFIGRATDGNTWCVTADNTMLCYFDSSVCEEYLSQSFSCAPVVENWKPGDYVGLLTYRVTCRYVPPFEQ